MIYILVNLGMIMMKLSDIKLMYSQVEDMSTKIKKYQEILNDCLEVTDLLDKEVEWMLDTLGNELRNWD